MMRLLVYVDGFNFYYGLFGRDRHGNQRPNSEKWINIVELAKKTARQIWPNQSSFEVIQLRYCTAQPIFDQRDPGQIQRHQQLMNAIDSLPNTKVILGSFVERTKNARLYAPSVRVARKSTEFFDGQGFGRPLRLVSQSDLSHFNLVGHTYEPNWSSKPKGGHPYTQSNTISVSMREEKGSDVNLGAYLVRDALKEEFDAALVFSNDSDLSEAISIAQTESGKEIWVVSPHFRNRAVVSGNPYSRQRALVNSATGVHVLDVTILALCQFPIEVKDYAGKIVARRPKEWK